jgi:hypothetical protein
VAATRIRKLRRITARALVVLTASLSLGPILHAGVGHDTDCDPVVVVHDPSQHAFASTRPAGGEALPSHDHCVTCHLFRISRLSPEAAAVHACESIRALAPPEKNFLLSTPVAVPLPARAPPSCPDIA